MDCLDWTNVEIIAGFSAPSLAGENKAVALCTGNVLATAIVVGEEIPFGDGSTRG